MKLTFESVLSGDFELAYTIPKSVYERYEEMISFRRGRDFNDDVREYVVEFVNTHKDWITEENRSAMDERLQAYNKLVADLKTDILSATTIPSVMIVGASNYPARRKEKELERIHNKEAELYSDNGKHARFLENTAKMFDPILIQQREDIQKMRVDRADKSGWKEFYQEIDDHDELTGYGIDIEAQRVYVTTAGKPSPELKPIIKNAAMRWSPRNVRWQRQLTANGIRAVKNLLTEAEANFAPEKFEQ